MVKLFKIQLNTKVTGGIPQITPDLEALTNKSGSDFRYSGVWDKPYPANTVFTKFHLEKNSNLTDFMGFYGDFMIFSKRFYNLLCEQEIEGIQDFEVPILDGNITELFHFVHIWKPLLEDDFVDWQSSVFFKEDHGHFTYLKYKNVDDYKHSGSSPAKLFTKINSVQNNMIRFRHLLATNIFISENFKNSIIRAQITGIQFEELRLYQNGE
ncbi:MAG: hypothetical protein J0L99_05330 [Chitinophagales bacterium]|nr:hypothetical protein [Chitinophagales bacterium]